jgi:hypothetical protein
MVAGETSPPYEPALGVAGVWPGDRGYVREGGVPWFLGFPLQESHLPVFFLSKI